MADAHSDMTLGIVLAPRSQNYTRASFQKHYEEFHAPLFYSFAKVAIGRYARNHIVRAIGADPHFETITEFGIFPDKRAEMAKILASPEGKVLEDDVKTFLAERGNNFGVSEILVSGPPRSFEPGPVRKRAILLKRSPSTPLHAFPALARAYADNVVRSLGASARRLTLTLWNPSPTPPIDAMLMIWPAAGATLPDRIDPPVGMDVAYALDVDGYMTAWRD